MAPLAPNSTARYYLDYNVAGEDHTLVMRVGSSITAAEASAKLDAFLTALGNTIYTLSIVGLRYSAAGSNISTPRTWGGDATYGSGTGTHADTANYYDFVGRTGGGRRARVSVFGATINRLNGDYRAEAGASALLDAARAELEADAGYFLGIDGQAPIWNDYTNLGINAYWRNEIR